MKVMAVDLGAPGGLVVLCDEGPGPPWVVCAVELGPNLTGLELQRLVHRLGKEHHVDLVATEKVGPWGRVKIAMAQREKQGLVRAVCEALQVPLVDYQPQVVKKAVTGNGRASKQQVGRCVRMLVKIASENEHVLDACALGIIALKTERHCRLLALQQRFRVRRSPEAKLWHSHPRPKGS